jgi:multisubunit Na+/H+ antiporter MnhF subunit
VVVSGPVIPAIFVNFFVASTGAGGALVGLLFVAVAVSPERTFGENVPSERRAVATSAFTALVNAFFVSLGSLIPDTTSAYVALTLSLVSLIGTVRLAADLVERGIGAKRLIRRLALIVICGVLYALEGWFAFELLRAPQAPGPVYSLAGVLMGVYGMAIVRAWELLGAERHGILGWLSPLRDIEPKPPPHARRGSQDARFPTLRWHPARRRRHSQGSESAGPQA